MSRRHESSSSAASASASKRHMSDDDDELHRMKMAQAYYRDALRNTDLNDSSISDMIGGAVADDVDNNSASGSSLNDAGHRESFGLLQRSYTTGDLRQAQSSSYLSYNGVTDQPSTTDDGDQIESSYSDDGSYSSYDSEYSSDFSDGSRSAHNYQIPKPPPRTNAPPLFGNQARNNSRDLLLQDLPEDDPDMVAKRQAMEAFQEHTIMANELELQRQREHRHALRRAQGHGHHHHHHHTKKHHKRHHRKHKSGNEEKIHAAADGKFDAADSDLMIAPNHLQESSISVLRKGGAKTVPGARLPGAYSMQGSRVQGRRISGIVTTTADELGEVEEFQEQEPVVMDPLLEDSINQDEEAPSAPYQITADCEFSSDDGMSHASSRRSRDLQRRHNSVFSRLMTAPSRTGGSSDDHTGSVESSDDEVSRQGNSALGPSSSFGPSMRGRSILLTGGGQSIGNLSLHSIWFEKEDSPDLRRQKHFRITMCLLCLVLVGGGIGAAIVLTGGKSSRNQTTSDEPTNPPSSMSGLTGGLPFFDIEVLQTICSQDTPTFNPDILPKHIIDAHSTYIRILDLNLPSINACTPDNLSILFISATGEQEGLKIASMYLLGAIYFATNGPTSWTDRGGWLKHDRFCDWKGVDCLGGHILGLNLAGRGLTGNIPTTLLHLTDLEEIRLDDNGLSGTIPTELGILSSLIVFDVARNKLTGTLPPELAGNMTNLRMLDFSINSISGSIPTEYARMTSLCTLGLHGANRLPKVCALTILRCS